MLSDIKNSRSRDFKREYKNFITQCLRLRLYALSWQNESTDDGRIYLKNRIKTGLRDLHKFKQIFRELFDRKKIVELVYLQFLHDYMAEVISWGNGNKRMSNKIMKEILDELNELTVKATHNRTLDI